METLRKQVIMFTWKRLVYYQIIRDGYEGFKLYMYQTINDRRLFPIQVLSIGCNLINVWTIQQASASRQKHKKDSSVVDVVRVARLDAGPSPDDPPQESAFRRHDILSIAVVVVVAADPSSSRQQSSSSSSSSWIVAGLVDGTIRVFPANFQEWANRIDVSPYDATGSCDCATTVDSLEDASPRLVPDDETPCSSTNAHTGRVTCVLCIPDTTVFAFINITTKKLFGFLFSGCVQTAPIIFDTACLFFLYYFVNLVPLILPKIAFTYVYSNLIIFVIFVAVNLRAPQQFPPYLFLVFVVAVIL